MAKRSFYVKDSELDDYQVKVIAEFNLQMQQNSD